MTGSNTLERYADDGKYPFMHDGFIYYTPTAREGYAHDTSRRLEIQSLENGHWFPLSIRPGTQRDMLFDSLWESSSEDNLAISGGPLFRDYTFGGTARILDIPGGGLRLATHVEAGSHYIIAGGDTGGATFVWDPRLGLCMHTKLRWPDSTDLANVFVFFGLWRDTENYVGLRFHTVESAQVQLVTRAAGVESTSPMGLPTTGGWHTLRIHFNRGGVDFAYGPAGAWRSTTNIPWALLMTPELLLETLADAEKKFDIRHIRLMQGD